MCGLAGVYDAASSTPEADLLRAAGRMAATLRHRGPDDGGAWADAAAGIAFGHRRLSVIDLSPEGHQPMTSRDGRYVLAFNGEIYNFRDIRRALEGSGASFRGHSDTEVLVEAIAAWGLARALERSNGMFAFAVWDRRERTLSLARDRLGEKPLYYGWAGRTLLFGSELKALRAHPAFAFPIDRDAIALYLRHKHIPAPHTIYAGVRKLPPGTVLHVRDGRAGEPEPYWSLRAVAEAGEADPFTGTDAEAIDQLDELLRDAVRIRMESDVPLGAFLSGGIDSSTVVALMQAQLDRPVRTFSIGFDDDAFDEGKAAAKVAAHLGTEHTALTLTPADVLNALPGLTAAYDEPFADSSQIATILVAELARRDVTVALSGDGGDELFGGYNRYTWVPAIMRRTAWMPASLRRGGAAVLTSMSPRSWDKVLGALQPVLPRRFEQRNAGDKVHKLAGALGARDEAQMYLRLVSHWADPSAVVLGAGRAQSPVQDRASWPDLTGSTAQMMYLDAATYLPDDILTKLDRATMAHSLEARVPLLDHRVAAFAWRLPLHMKVRAGTGKWVLRQLLERSVPHALTHRPKMGFGVPIGSWLRGPLRAWAEPLLDPERLRADGFFDPRPIERAWRDHQSGRRSMQYHLWDVLMFQAWLDAGRAPVLDPVVG